jgi:hypothetical protein
MVPFYSEKVNELNFGHRKEAEGSPIRSKIQEWSA